MKDCKEIIPQPGQAHSNDEKAIHERGSGKSFDAMCLNNSIYNNTKSSGGFPICKRLPHFIFILSPVFDSPFVGNSVFPTRSYIKLKTAGRMGLHPAWFCHFNSPSQLLSPVIFCFSQSVHDGFSNAFFTYRFCYNDVNIIIIFKNVHGFKHIYRIIL